MARRGAREGNIRQRKDRLWEGRIRYTDPITGLRERASVYGRRQLDVVEKLREIQRRVSTDEPVRDEHTALADFLDYWLEYIVKPSKRNATYRSYKTTIDNHISKTRLGVIALANLRAPAIQHTLVGKEAPTRSRALALIVLRSALDYAVDTRFIRSNPAAKIKTPIVESKDKVILTQSDARCLLKSARKDRLFGLYYLALHTGMRLGELLALEWRDIDFKHSIIHVSRSRDNRTGKVGPVKTKSAKRAIALGPEAKTVLREQQKRMQSDGHPGSIVFTAPAGGVLLPRNFQRRSFKPLLIRAKLPDVRFHDLRHSAAMLMLAAGVHPKIVSDRLGHARIGITMDLYQDHINPQLQRPAAILMDRALSAGQKRDADYRGGKYGGKTRKHKSP